MKIHQLLASVPLIFCPIVCHAANGDWSATPVDAVFSNTANWVGGVVPGYTGGGSDNNDIATFGTSTRKALTLSQDLWIGGFSINSSGYSFNVGTNNLAIFGDGAGGGGVSVSTGTASISVASPGTFTATGGNYNNITVSATGTTIAFTENSSGGNNLVISTSGSAGVEFSTTSFTIGSISGFGNYTISTALTVGGNNSSNSVNASATGSGSVNKIGSGTLTLLNTWGHTGGTTISEGALQLGGNGSTGGLSTTNAIVNNSTLIVHKTSGTTLNGIISGTGALIKRGSAALTLGGTNTFSGGTTLEAGTLSLSNNSALGSSTLTVAGNGNLQSNNDARTISNNIVINNGVSLGFTNTNNLTLSGTISGAGSISKTNTNTVILTGANSYTGGTSITSGTIQGNTSSLQGNITNNAAIIFSQSTDGTYSQVISGSGTVTKEGTGTVTFGGNNSYSGATTVNAGSLKVNGTINSNVTVNTSAFLRGIGNVGAINSIGGTVAPGDTLGTLTSNGNLSLDAASTLQIQLSPASSSTLNVNGIANLDGTLNLVYAAGSYSQTEYTILNATNINGEFSSITSSNAPSGFSSTLQMLANKIIVKLQSVSKISQRVTGYAQNAAIFLQNVQNGSPTSAQSQLFNSINAMQNSAQLQSALNQIYPTVMGNFQALNIHMQQQQQTELRLAALHQHYYVAGDQNSENGLWVRGFYQGGRQGNLKNLLGYTANTSGIVVGYDHDISPRLTLGVAGSYAYSVVNSIDYYNTATNIKTYLGTLYGGLALKNNNYIDWLLSAGKNNYDGNRTINVAPTYVTAVYNTIGQQYSAQAIFGKNIKYNKYVVTPSINANYVYLNQHGYSESNAGSLGLTVASNSSSVFTVGAGLKGMSTFQCYKFKYVPEIHAMGYYDLKSGTQNIASTFITGGPSLQTTSNPGRITGQIGTSLNIYLKDNLEFKIEYDFIGKDKYTNNIAYVQVRYSF